jgi:lipopolysaccharide/colanic/teichoic acid biosynthesis glycosyltransferase
MKNLSAIKRSSEKELDVYSEVEFNKILRRERAKADRSDLYFSIVVFNFSTLNIKEANIYKFIRLLKNRVRDIDVIGWLEEKALGVLLYATTRKEAEAFIATIKEAIYSYLLIPQYHIYAYPDDFFNDFNQHEPQKPTNRTENKASHAILLKTNSPSSHADVKSIVENKLVKSIPYWKRFLDLVISLAVIILSSPLLILITLYIKIVSPGPVIFKQQRVGYKGKIFTFYKFRTMKVNNDASNHQSYVKSLINSEKPMEKLDHGKDPRIIPGGKILRKTSLDELPQLFNVLKGDMSLIGPRPCIIYEAREFDRWHKQRFDVLPGLTGLWQVSGKNRLTFKQMIRLDILYGKRMSLLTDLKIFILTIPTVIGLIFEKALHAPETQTNNN